jgi:hypothetical protein
MEKTKINRLMPWRLTAVMKGLTSCNPAWAKIRRIVFFLLIWFFMWLSNILFGIENAASMAQSLQLKFPFLAEIPDLILIILLILVLPVAGIRFLLMPFFVSGLCFYVGSRFIAEIYSMQSVDEAFNYLFSILFGLKIPKINIKGGETKDQRVLFLRQIGGPAFVEVDRDSAAIVERLTSPSDIFPLHESYATRFERVKQVYDLSEKTVLISDIPLLTKDRLVVRVKDAEIRFQVDQSTRKNDDFSRGEKDRWRNLQRSLRRIHYQGCITGNEKPSWEERVIAEVVAQLRQYVNETPCDLIAYPPEGGPNPREEIEARMASRQFTIRLLEIGVKLNKFDFRLIDFSEEYNTTPNFNLWKENLKSRMDVMRAGGEAESRKYYERSRSEAMMELLKDIVKQLTSIDLSARPPMGVRMILGRVSQRLLHWSP